jgi:hypothetical protein
LNPALKQFCMRQLVPVFQFEIRYDHILTFSQIARKVLAPYVRLTQSINVENQNTVEERIILNFEEENYLIIVSWDRILLRGQNDINPYLSKNSPLEMPFLAILAKLKELEEFGSIKSVLIAVTFIKELTVKKEDLFLRFSQKYLAPETQNILEPSNDLAITFEDRAEAHETSVTFGPYLGIVDLNKRPLKPINFKTLDDSDFLGIMLEYKHGYSAKTVTFSDFENLVKEANKIFKRLWAM